VNILNAVPEVRRRKERQKSRNEQPATGGLFRGVSGGPRGYPASGEWRDRFKETGNGGGTANHANVAKKTMNRAFHKFVGMLRVPVRLFAKAIRMIRAIRGF